MKKIIALAVCAIAISMGASTANAQQRGDMAAGFNAVFAAGDGGSFGIGPKFQYNVTDPLRLEASFTYFFERNYVRNWDLSANAHWLFPVAQRWNVYPLAGLCYFGAAGKFSDVKVSTSNWGVNLGGGVDYLVGRNTLLNAEVKYKLVNKWNQLVVSVGAAWMF